jgi:hypothetical protein
MMALMICIIHVYHVTRILVMLMEKHIARAKYVTTLGRYELIYVRQVGIAQRPNTSKRLSKLKSKSFRNLSE